MEKWILTPMQKQGDVSTGTDLFFENCTYLFSKRPKGEKSCFE